jgi:ABC-type amino acid transport substrate-binding protein
MSSPTPITPEFPGLPGRRPRRRLRAALGAALVATLAVGGALGGPPARPAAAREAARSSPTVAEIRARGEIVVGTKFDQPLFGLRDATTGEVDGFDVEIARLVVREVFGRRVARNIRFVETPSRTREDALTSGAADLVVATYTITPEREAVSTSPARTTPAARPSSPGRPTPRSGAPPISAVDRCAPSPGRPRPPT